MLDRISFSALLRPPDLLGAFELPANSGSFASACAFYALDTSLFTATNREVASLLPFVTVLKDIMEINMLCARKLSLTATTEKAVALRGTLSKSLAISYQLVERFSSTEAVHAAVHWNPATWLSITLAVLDHEVRSDSFSIVRLYRIN